MDPIVLAIVFSVLSGLVGVIVGRFWEEATSKKVRDLQARQDATTHLYERSYSAVTEYGTRSNRTVQELKIVFDLFRLRISPLDKELSERVKTIQNEINQYYTEQYLKPQGITGLDKDRAIIDAHLAFLGDMEPYIFEWATKPSKANTRPMLTYQHARPMTDEEVRALATNLAQSPPKPSQQD